MCPTLFFFALLSIVLSYGNKKVILEISEWIITFTRPDQNSFRDLAMMLLLYFTDHQICSLFFFVFSIFLSEAEINNFFQTNTVQHLALIFEDAKSYIGREVTTFFEILLWHLYMF